MLNRHTAAVIIPIYKDELTYFETLSLKQCFKILSKYPIIFAAPEKLDFTAYSSLCHNDDYQIFRFENIYFQNIEGYNKLMLSAHFYKRFLQYKFVLIYQLDAYVFKDDLLYWCNKNYDFIGAPDGSQKNQPGTMQFLKNYGKFLAGIKKTLLIDHKISNASNGGFSLRKTRSFYWLLSILTSRAHKWRLNEDFFFNYWGNLLYPLFKLPTDATALEFSIETAPAASLQKLGNKLPFGCHAFERYDLETWKPFIFHENKTI